VKELGEYMRQARKTKNYTLEQIAAAINVNVEYLRALEDGHFETLPPEIYVRGFLISFANFLGLDQTELFQKYDSEKPLKKKKFFGSKDQEQHKPAPVVQQQPKEPQQSVKFADIVHQIKAIPAAIYVIAIGIIVVGTVIVFVALKTEKPPETMVEAIFGDTTMQHASTMPLDEDISQSIRITLDSINAAQALSIAESVTFLIKAKEPVDIYIERDHIKDFKGKLTPAENRVWRVNNSIYIETNNPAALKISANGFDLAQIDVRRFQSIEINRQNVLQFLEGYQPPPEGVISAYGQRIEAAVKDTVKGPPRETPKPKVFQQVNKPPQQQPAVTPTSSTNTTIPAPVDTTQKSKPKLKPPKPKTTSDQTPTGG
jgi:cytoskeletal protein RodZ